MKDVKTSEQFFDVYAKDVAMLDKFRCDQIVHFYGVCVTPYHVTFVMGCAPWGSFRDCVKKLPESSDVIKRNLMLDAVRGL